MLNARVLKLPENAAQHTHEHHQVVIGLQGNSGLAGQGWGVDLDNRRACLVPTETRHDYFGNDINHVLVIDLDRAAPALSNPQHHDYDRLAPLFDRPQHLDMDTRLQSLIHLCASELNQAPENRSLHEHFATGIVHCLSNRLSERYRFSRRRPQTFDVAAIRRYIHAHLHQKITIRDLASEACLSVSRFHETFREMTGVSPHQYVIQVRLEQAVRLLTTTSLSVSEISYRSGFSSQSAFTNALRKHKGMTPAKMRLEQSVVTVE
ncbi:AraC family transcriptional regulator [Marinobacter nanhaiticus D15-8W]|uniref:AraC family transcriptional regulator n=2 Tax=Marinobacter TaxID=2742 RepID=N6WXW0_9GAMM|nr:AraC family transcriptional regulator [Marinobacter nanhaiticus D15-8W]BES70989.1 AraC family transcriptional regulator [Marinobacter nanhaiticus D15-8W]